MYNSKSEPKSNYGLWVKIVMLCKFINHNKGALWQKRLLIMGKAVLVRVGREKMEPLYPPLSFVVNLILFFKKKIKKKKATRWMGAPPDSDLSKHQNITYSLQVRPGLATMLSSFPKSV